MDHKYKLQGELLKWQHYDRELMQQALDALDVYVPWQKKEPIVEALRERLAQPERESAIIEQEPVAYLRHDSDHVVLAKHKEMYGNIDRHLTPLYTAPPHNCSATQKRKPLTKEQIQEIEDNTEPFAYELARAIEAAHGIKEQE